MANRTNPRSFIDSLTRGTAAPAIVIAATGRILADRLLPAFTRAARNQGLLGRSSLPEGWAMVLAPCSAIHTFFMKFAIDVLFVSRDGRVLKAMPRCRPFRLAIALGASAVIELPAGAIAASGVRVGDLLTVSAPRLR